MPVPSQALRRACSAAALLRRVVVGGLGAATFLLLPASGGAQETPAGTRPPSVRVSASGSVEVSPDRAVVILAVETEADSAAVAASRNAERMERVIDALLAAGIPEEAIETSGYRLHPEYRHEPPPPGPRPEVAPEEPRIVGYRAVNEVRVTVDSLDAVGEVIDAAIGAGANRVTHVAFEASDPETARLEALRKAVERARARAEALAAAAGRRLGALLEVTAGETGGPGPVMEAMELPAPEARLVPTPVRPGTLTVTETVTAVWRLEG